MEQKSNISCGAILALLAFVAMAIILITQMPGIDSKPTPSPNVASSYTPIEEKVLAIDKIYSGSERYTLASSRIRYLLRDIGSQTGYTNDRIAEIAFQTKKLFATEKGLDFSMQEILELFHDATLNSSEIKLKLEEISAYLVTTVTRK